VSDISDQRHIGDPATFAEVADFELSLLRLLESGCYVLPGLGLIETKQLVERLGSLRIEIYSRDHVPPHFHVVGPDIDAAFSIKDCELLHGSISRKDADLVRYWFAHCGIALVEMWNRTRPSDRPAGPAAERVT